MVPPEQWVGLIALSKTMLDATKSAIDFVATLKRYRDDPQTLIEAHNASALYSTYSSAEVDSISESIKACQKRFEAEGIGVNRARCLCSVLKNVADGNGGELPDIGEWPKMFEQLKCANIPSAQGAGK